MKHLNVLIACEESQAECIAFRALGHKAYSCDIQKCRRGGHPEWHICGDVTPLLEGRTQFYTQDGKHHHLSRWHLIIAHPPCTYLCKVSSVQLHTNPDLEIEWRGKKMWVNGERYVNLQLGRKFFFKCLNAKCDHLAVENPIPMALAQLPPPSSFACPSWFGFKYTKKTLYWTRNLPPLMAEKIFPNPKSLVHCSRDKYRSRTYPGLADAIAKQWGDYCVKELGINMPG